MRQTDGGYVVKSHIFLIQALIHGTDHPVNYSTTITLSPVVTVIPSATITSEEENRGHHSQVTMKEEIEKFLGQQFTIGLFQLYTEVSGGNVSP
jgi:hypothetical protein